MSDGNLFDLTGKTAIVTGGGRGLGKAIALGYAAAGADVVVASRKVENCEAAAREIEALGRRALAVGCHVGRTEQIDALVDEAYGAFGQVDIVVNNAAMSPGTALAESSPELFQKTYATNALGPMWLASRCAERMRDHGGGAVINVITTGAFRPGAGLGLYCSSKAALVMLAQCIALDHGPAGVRANVVCPGWARTPMGDRAMDWLAHELGREREEAYAEATRHVPLRRACDPEEVAGAIAWLLSSEASYVNGAVLTVDGGSTIVDTGALAFAETGA
jgi:NAD(P)-dependent dehydrogenase (short-subunit alcohol dehydrogenase family)